MYGKKRNLFYTDMFYPFTATKYKCKIRSQSKIEYCIKNHSFKIIKTLQKLISLFKKSKFTSDYVL